MSRETAARGRRPKRGRTRQALMDAALDLVATDGVAAVTVRGVCAQARLNDRYFYESFRGDIDEVRFSFVERYTEDFTLATAPYTPPKK